METLIATHDFCLSSNRGSESLWLKTEFFDNGDYDKGLKRGIFTNQKLVFLANYNDFSFNLVGITLDASILRKLADYMDSAYNDVMTILQLASSGKECCVLTRTFNLSPKEFDSESLFIEIKFFDNGDGIGGVFMNQTITLKSYCNEASLNLAGDVIEPKPLRELANELERKMNEISKWVMNA